MLKGKAWGSREPPAPSGSQHAVSGIGSLSGRQTLLAGPCVGRGSVAPGPVRAWASLRESAAPGAGWACGDAGRRDLQGQRPVSLLEKLSDAVSQLPLEGDIATDRQQPERRGALPF